MISIRMAPGAEKAVDLSFYKKGAEVAQVRLPPKEWDQFVKWTRQAFSEDGPQRFGSSQDRLGEVGGMTVWRLSEASYGTTALYTYGGRTLTEVHKSVWVRFNRRLNAISRELKP